MGAADVASTRVARCASRSSRSMRIRAFAVVIAANRDEYHARPARPPPGGTKAGSPGATSRPAARGSASRATAAGRSSPTSASPIAAIRARPRAARSSRASLADAAPPVRSVAAIVAAARPTTVSTCSPATRRPRAGDRTGRRRHARACAAASTACPMPCSTRRGRRSRGRRRRFAAWCARGDDDLGALFAVLARPDASRPTTSCRRPAFRSSGSGCSRRRSSSARRRLRHALLDGRD